MARPWRRLSRSALRASIRPSPARPATSNALLFLPALVAADEALMRPKLKSTPCFGSSQREHRQLGSATRSSMRQLQRRISRGLAIIPRTSIDAISAAASSWTSGRRDQRRGAPANARDASICSDRWTATTSADIAFMRASRSLPHEGQPHLQRRTPKSWSRSSRRNRRIEVNQRLR